MLHQEWQAFLHRLQIDLKPVDAAQRTHNVAEDGIDIGVDGHHLQLLAVDGKPVQASFQHHSFGRAEFARAILGVDNGKQLHTLGLIILFIREKQVDMADDAFANLCSGLAGESEYQDVVRAESIGVVVIQQDANVFHSQAVGLACAGAGSNDPVSELLHARPPYFLRYRSALEILIRFCLSVTFFASPKPSANLAAKASLVLDSH